LLNGLSMQILNAKLNNIFFSLLIQIAISKLSQNCVSGGS